MKLFTFSRRCKRIAVICFLLCSGLNAQTAGDANGDNKYDISDVVYGINYIFGGGAAPRFGDEKITLKWPAPGASSERTYAGWYQVTMKQYGIIDTLIEFAAGLEHGGDTVRIVVNLPVDGIEREYQVRYHSRYIEETDSLYTIPGLVIARVGKEWRRE